MNNPQPEPVSPCYTGDPTRPFLAIADPAARLRAARRAQRLAEAKNLSRRYVLIATSFALLPLPLVDLAAVLALQVKLVHDLSHLYGVPFESSMAKPLLASLLSCGAVSGGGLALMGLGLTFPGLRILIGGGFSGSLAGTTLATSEIFIRHFEAGGTMVDFDPHTAQLPPAAPVQAPSSLPQAEEDQPQSPVTPAVPVQQHPSPQQGPPTAEPPTSEPPTAELQSTNSKSSAQESIEQKPTELEPSQTPSAEPQSAEPQSTEPNSTHLQQADLQSSDATGNDSTLVGLFITEPPITETSTAEPAVIASSRVDSSLIDTSTPAPSIPINSEPTNSSSVELPLSDLERIYGIGNIYANRLIAVGINNFSALAALKPERLRQILGQRVSLASARDFIAQAKTMAQMNSS